MYQLDNSPGRTASVDGKEYLFFSGYSYLGMSHVPGFIKLIKEGIDRYGLLHPSARISNTQLELYNQFELELSILTGQAKSISFSSGYLAGRAVAELFIDKQALIIEGTHPVLKNRLNSFSGTLDELVGFINSSDQDSYTIVSDSVNPLKATMSNYSFLNDINNNKKIICIIDDSHGIGLTGKNGKGVASYLPKLTNVEYIITYSLSKAFHINGGAVSGGKNAIDKLNSSPFYTGSTGIAPSFIYAFRKGYSYYEKQQKILQQNIQYFIELIKDLDLITYHPSLPVFVINQELDDDFFEKTSIIISSFSYPNPDGYKINRVVLNALHTKEDLEKLSSVLHLLIV